MRLIRKYTNKQLYDVETSSFITKKDIKELIMNNISFKIINTMDIDETKKIIRSLLPGLDIPVTKVKNLIRSYS